jgi:MoaA/NifB/PqqE/SkfB family radical SAM enzyme
VGFRAEQLYRYRKYLEINLSHLTPTKLANMARVEWRLFRGNPDMRGLSPYNLVVDPSNRCNLRCPLCFAGQRRLVPRQGLMTLENYVRIVEPVKERLLQVFLYNNSEPLLNPEICDIIRWNRANNIGSVLSSNLSLKIQADEIVDSGLEYLVLSVDGATQEVYEQYRVGGRLDLVLENLGRIIEARSRKRARHPFIEWQVLVTSRNEEQLDDIKRLAARMGVDVVRPANLNFYAVDGDRGDTEEAWLPRSERFRAFASERIAVPPGATRRPCFWLWRTAVISANGGVIPCCLFDTADWGNALEEPLAEIWNGETYRGARELGLSSPARRAAEETVCRGCRAPFVWDRGSGARPDAKRHSSRRD